jgi:hypothetical protein
MCQPATGRPHLILIVLLILAVLSGGCVSRRLPAKGASALREHVNKLADTDAAFEVVSA